MRVILDHTARKGAIRGDRAWAFFCETKLSPEGDEGFWGFANRLWNALAKKTGILNRDSRGPVIVSIPELEPAAMDFVARLVSFWSTDVRERRGRTLSGNRWRAPVVNVLNDQAREGAEKTLVRETDADGSTELNLMPLLGPGRAFFSVQVIEKGGVTARMHSHSAVDEYYLILEGKGTLRYNGRAVPVERGDIIGKPTGPDAATHLLANRGERLRILDWRSGTSASLEPRPRRRTSSTGPTPRRSTCEGPVGGALIPRDAMVSTTDLETHWSEAYRRTKDGKRRITKSRAWTK